ncbi:MAG: DUF2961 domain-containing protein [Victivallaceae bacterium]
MDIVKDFFALENLPLQKNWQAFMASSYDREGGNYDFGQYPEIIEANNNMEGVVLDVDGLGVITRIWSANPAGHLKIYLDNNPVPVVDEPFEEFLRRSPLRWGNGFLRRGSPEFAAVVESRQALGVTSYLPIPFNKGCRITLTPPRNIYYQVNYLLCDVPHSLESFSLKNMEKHAPEYCRIKDILSGKINSQGKNSIAGKIDLKPGTRSSIAEITSKSHTIRSLRIKIKWPNDETIKKHMQEKLLLRVFWDEDLAVKNAEGEKLPRRFPSVKAPLAFFFMDFGHFEEYRTALIDKSLQNGYLCRFPMPAREHSLLELINASCFDTGEIDYEITYDEDCEPAVNRKMHFKALYHMEDSTFGTDRGDYRDKVMYLRNQDGHRNYQLLNTWGQGHFIGCCFHVDGSETPFPRALCESDEAVFVDGNPGLTMWGTGNEDYANDAWGFHPVISDISGGCSNNCLTCDNGFYGYRFHFSDAIPYRKKIAFTLEHGSSNNCTALYRSVAYYYQASKGPNVFIDGVSWPRKIKQYFTL